MGVSKAIKSGTKTRKAMAKAQVTIPLGIADVRVLQTSASERGGIIITKMTSHLLRHLLLVDFGIHVQTFQIVR